jgi:hypothetical protein
MASPGVPSSGLRLVGDGLPVGTGSAAYDVPAARPSLGATLKDVPRWLLAFTLARWVFVHVFVICAAIGMLAPQAEGRALRTALAHDATAGARADATGGGCALVGDAVRVAEDAQAAAGLEVAFVGELPAIGFVRGDGEAVAMQLDPQTLAAKGEVRRRPKSTAHRATPVDMDGALDVATDAAPATDRRLVPRADGYLSVTRKKEGLTLAVLSGAGAAVGTPSKIARAATQLGTPTLAVVGDAALVAWAERSGDAPWSIQLTRWDPAQGAPAPAQVAADAISPSLVPVGEDRAMLVWADGPVTAHRVRAQLFDKKGARLGAPAAVSPEGMNAGAPRALVGKQGRGVAAYFAVTQAGMDVWAARVACASRGGS